MRCDSSGPKWKPASIGTSGAGGGGGRVVGGCCDTSCCCRCSRNLSTWVARARSSMARGETIVTVFFSLRVCCWPGTVRCSVSTTLPSGGDVYDRPRMDDSSGTLGGETLSDRRSDAGGKTERFGDLCGVGDVALLYLLVCLVVSSLVFSSLTVLSLSSVACRLARSEDVLLLPCWFNTPLNMMLYLSILMSGISTSNNPVRPSGAPDAVDPGELAHSFVGSFDSGCPVRPCIVRSISDSVLDRMMIGLCLGTFLPVTVLLLEGLLTAVCHAGVEVEATFTVTADRLASMMSMAFGSAFFLPPNKDPNNLLRCVLVLWMGGAGGGGYMSGGGGGACGCQAA